MPRPPRTDPCFDEDGTALCSSKRRSCGCCGGGLVCTSHCTKKTVAIVDRQTAQPIRSTRTHGIEPRRAVIGPGPAPSCSDVDLFQQLTELDDLYRFFPPKTAMPSKEALQRECSTEEGKALPDMSALSISAVSSYIKSILKTCAEIISPAHSEFVLEKATMTANQQKFIDEEGIKADKHIAKLVSYLSRTIASSPRNSEASRHARAVATHMFTTQELEQYGLT